MTPTDLAIRIAIGLALVGALVAGYFGWRGHQRDIGRNEVRAEWARQVAQAQQQQTDEAERRRRAQEEADHAHQTELARARADADRARAAAGGLRQQLAAFTAAGRDAGCHPAPDAGSPPAASALDLLADLFSRADDVAGDLAQALDLSRAAGLACERKYDALTR